MHVIFACNGFVIITSVMLFATVIDDDDDKITPSINDNDLNFHAGVDLFF